MARFYLADGAMTYAAVRSSKAFADSEAPWVAALLPGTELRLAGPMLVSADGLGEAGGAVESEVLRVIASYPSHLNVSIIDSTANLDTLAGHLRRFCYFADGTGQTYGLRIADCRVIEHLLGVLAPSQWDALTAPMDQWGAHDRSGQERLLPMKESRLQCSGGSAQITLTDEQIDHLIRKNEPDALLAKIDRDPQAYRDARLQRLHDIATACLKEWRKRGGANYGVLLAFARIVIRDHDDVFSDPARVERVMQAAIAMVRR